MTSFYRSEYISSFHCLTIAAAEASENWNEELLVPAQGRLVYVGQGQAQFVHFHEPTPGLLWPKKKTRRKKKAVSQPPAPSPPVGEDWEADICPPAPPKEDWDAEIAAFQ
jgi:hypothetical protein